jgi:hypothetical protein
MWQHAHLTLDADDDAAVFFEDDVVVPDLLDLKVNDLRIELNYVFPDWDLVFLGLAETDVHVWQKVTERIGKPDSRLCRLDCPFGTHAMMIRKRGLRVMLDAMTRAERNLDQQLWEYALRPGLLKWCAVLPSMVTQRTFDYAGSGKPQWAASTVDAAVTSKPTQEDPSFVSATAKLIDPFPCIYRGEWLDATATNARGKTVPVAECARLDAACVDRRGFVPTDDAVKRCETCALRVEMAPDSPRGRLPLPEGHFNPSMLMYRGRLILATRDSWGHSKVGLWELHNEKDDWTGVWSCAPIASHASDHKFAPRLEDPRLFLRRDPRAGDDRLCAMFNLPDGYPPKHVQVGYCQFTEDLSGVEFTDVFQSPHGNLYEKNWVPFCNEYGVNWVYATKPKHVVLTDHGNYVTDNDLPWTGGFVRGGAAPVCVPHHTDPSKDSYYHFFHGCLKRVQGSVYTVGCVVFDAKPPYKVLRQTRLPLVWPDLPAVGESVVKRYVVWPGGAVAHAGAWHLALGIDDTYCRIVRIPFDAVEASLNDVPEESRLGSLRASIIATGAQN